jgi:hypothetical protein
MIVPVPQELGVAVRDAGAGGGQMFGAVVDAGTVAVALDVPPPFDACTRYV